MLPCTQLVRYPPSRASSPHQQHTRKKQEAWADAAVAMLANKGNLSVGSVGNKKDILIEAMLEILASSRISKPSSAAHVRMMRAYQVFSCTDACFLPMDCRFAFIKRRCRLGRAEMLSCLVFVARRLL
mmetsp:Transcript_89813/g.140423  ORF Transcript_89813/g.140423 Transcript_89813/m.140423 type:complete len:128 (+) Transcript_89813:1006-1389(+)